MEIESAPRREFSLLAVYIKTAPGITAVLTAIAFIVAVLMQYGWVLFSVHPIMMSISCSGMLLGIAVYRIGGITTSKSTLRFRHLLLMTSAVICALLGITAIVTNKVIHGKTVVPSSTHSMLGLLAILLVLLQGVFGVLKYYQLQYGNSVHSWHGRSGPVFVVIFIAAAASGVYESAIGPEASTILAIISSVLIVSVLLARARQPFKTQDYDELTPEEKNFQMRYGQHTVPATKYGDDL